MKSRIASRSRRLAAPTEWSSQAETSLNCVVVQTLPSVQLRQALPHLGEEHQALNRVFHGGILRQVAKRVEYLLLTGRGFHRRSIARRSGPMHPLSFVPVSSLSRSEEHTSELQSRLHLVCRLLLEKKKKNININKRIHKKKIELEVKRDIEYVIDKRFTWD